MEIGIIDYGMGNLRSVAKGFEKAGATARIITTPHEVNEACALVLPGVGAFKDCIKNLDTLGLITPVLTHLQSGKPFLGICLGLQVLFSESVEFGVTPGLGVLDGKVVRFQRDEQKKEPGLKIPHMGWNTISASRKPPHLAGVADGSFLYFVHSYYVVPDDPRIIATTTRYGCEFVSSIWKDNIFACQFHPEKSQSIGLQILKNFAALAAKN